MRVLAACECSGLVREAFLQAGHDAYSCDLQPSEIPSDRHLQADVRNIISRNRWDMIIAFPPCTDLAVSGARWFKEKRADGRQQASIDFFLFFTRLDSKIKVCIENPVGIMSSVYRKPDQIIQPWMFGHRETKATCLWLQNLPKLEPTEIVGPPRTPEEKKEFAKVHLHPPGPDRATNRSRTFKGIAAAMAAQFK